MRAVSLGSLKTEEKIERQCGQHVVQSQDWSMELSVNS